MGDVESALLLHFLDQAGGEAAADRLSGAGAGIDSQHPRGLAIESLHGISSGV